MTEMTESLASVARFQRDILKRLHRYAKKVDHLQNQPLADAHWEIDKTTHNSPILAYIGHGGYRALAHALQDRLADETVFLDKNVKDAIFECLKDMDDYDEGDRSLKEVQAEWEFFEHEGKKAQYLFLLATIYKKKVEKVEKTGVPFAMDFDSWLRTQTTKTLIPEGEEDTALNLWMDEHEKKYKAERRLEKTTCRKKEDSVRKLVERLTKSTREK